jgi:hypothetical protein
VVIGAIKPFADPRGIEGDPLEWIDLLIACSKPGYYLPDDNPVKPYIEGMEAFELSRIVSAAIGKHRPLIRKLKEMEQLNQNLAVSLMVERAYIRGACDAALFAWKHNDITRNTAEKIADRTAETSVKLWKEAAKIAAGMLLQIRKHVWLKGRKGNPASLGLAVSTRALLDDEILDHLRGQAPQHLRKEKHREFGFIKSKIVSTVKEQIRLGKLMCDGDPLYYQDCVDVHARRLRKRLKKHYPDCASE